MQSATALAGICCWALTAEAEEQRALNSKLSGEATLARAAARGDRDAFARLVQSHGRAVHGLCARMLSDPEEARDAAQETFVRAWGALDTYDASQPFAPWLLRIARNLAIDALRRRIPADRRLELDARGDEGSGLELEDHSRPAADEQLERAEAARGLDAAVSALPPRYREVIHLFHVEHMSYKEIASTLEVPIGTVMTWLYRARGMLRSALVAADGGAAEKEAS